MGVYKSYIRPFLHHPLNKKGKVKAIARFLRWQYKLRLVAPYEIIVPFIGSSKFIVKKGRTGLTGNLYSGLHEFYDMMFVLHFLKEGDVFFDVGANVGSYSILSAICKRTFTYSFEPVPDSFRLLKNNRDINISYDKWFLVNSAVGDTEEELLFSTDRDTMNSVVEKGYKGSKLKVPVITLSKFCKEKSVVPLLIKIDAEGYDNKVISGAQEILSDPRLQGIIVEGGEEAIVEQLSANGFQKVSYDPFVRDFSSQNNESTNSLYIKDIMFCKDRVARSEKIEVLDYWI